MPHVSHIEPINEDEVLAADRKRWCNSAIAGEEHAAPAERLFKGPKADLAPELLQIVHHLPGKIAPDMEIGDGVMVADILGGDTAKGLETLYEALDRHKRYSRIKAGERRTLVHEDGTDEVETRWIISDNCVVIGDPAGKQKYLRRLPWAPSDTHEVEGVGTIVLESVGSTAYSGGVYVYVQREGVEEAEPGYMSWSASWNEDGAFEWTRNAIRGLSGPDITDPDLVAAVEGLLDTWPEREPTKWCFHAKDAARKELDPYRHQRREAEQSIADLEEAKSGRPTGRRKTLTPEQIDHALGSYQKALARLDRVADRMAHLEGIVKTIRGWFSTKDTLTPEAIRTTLPFARPAPAERAVSTEEVQASFPGP